MVRFLWAENIQKMVVSLLKKSLFNKTPLFYTSEQEIKDASELSGDLETKFLESFKYLSKLSWGDKILQGDLMFTDTDKKTETIGNLEYVTFQLTQLNMLKCPGSLDGSTLS